MNTTLREMLAGRASNVDPPHLDIGELAGLGESRLRRRRVTAVLGSVAAVVVVIALTVALGSGLNGPVKRSDGPVGQPTSSPEAPLPRPVRKIVYSDVEQRADGLSGDTVHFGIRMVETGTGFVHMDVTDDGFVYLTDEGRRLWFSDGGEPEQIGSGVCGDSAGFPGVQVKTSNAGSLVAWFDCSGPGPAALVVFDTSVGSEVVRRPVTGCGDKAQYSQCHPDAIIGDHVYFTRSFPDSALEFDRATGRVTAAYSYAEDVRSHPRGLVIGDSWETGRPTTGIGEQFLVVGSRLVPEKDPDGGGDGGAPLPTRAFDTATGRPVRLQMPSGYHGADEFHTFEWLDDDTFALVGPSGWDNTPGYGDILTCRLSNRRCELTVPGQGPVRVVANGGTPG